MDPDQQLTDVCFHHIEVYLARYTRNQNKCCDPYHSHKRPTQPARNGEISLALSVKGENRGLQLVPGQKLCKACKTKVDNSLKTTPIESNDSPDNHSVDEAADAADEPPQSSTPVPLDSPRQQLNVSLSELGVSPLRMHGVRADNRVAHGKRKMEKVKAAQGEKSAEVATKVARALDVSPEQLSSFGKDAEYDRLTDLVKGKIRTSSDKRQIVQLLTLAPLSWSVRKVAMEYSVLN